MKLEYDNLKKKEYNVRIFISAIMFTALILECIILMLFINSDEIINIMLFLMIFLIAIVSILGIYRNIKNNKNTEDIKKLGVKIHAYILETCTILKGTGGHSRIKVKCLKIGYDNKITIIEFIKENNAYALLEMLLNPYPIKEKIDIPIDVYMYNNKIYADLESVDLTKIKGYEECKKIIDKLYT